MIRKTVNWLRWLFPFIGGLSLFLFVFALTEAGAAIVKLTAVAADTRYVATSGNDSGNDCLEAANPCAGLQHAIDQASNGDTILVAEGTYTENIDITKVITLYGGYEASGWTRDLGQHETVINGSNSGWTPGDWDLRVAKAAVISDSSEYKMWYGARDIFQEAHVGLATSSNGITWTKHAGNPVLSGSPGEWDQEGPYVRRWPFVLKEAGTYKIWYGGTDGDVDYLGYASSSNGIDWNKHATNPVLQAGPESYDQDGAFAGAVLNDGGTYKLWYSARGDQGSVIAYATSPDGINWQKQGPALKPADNSSGGWDNYFVDTPSVLKQNGTYWMWYTGQGSGGSGIGVVTSTNGITWTRFLTDPVLTDFFYASAPHVISDSGKLKMWYNSAASIYYAESNDGISWTKSPNNPVLTYGQQGQSGLPVVSIAGSDGGAVLDGFTVTGGQANVSSGIYIASLGSTLVANTFISGNQSVLGGSAGVYVRDSNATIRDSIVTNNQGRGIEAAGSSHLTLESSTISNHTASGYGGGLLFDDAATAELRDVVVRGNTAQYGGGGIQVEDESHVQISEATIVSNTAGYGGGGIRLRGSMATGVIDDSVVENNVGIEGAGGVEVAGQAHLTMSNSLVSGNSNLLENGFGGSGIYFGWETGGSLTNVTVADNTVSGGIGGVSYTGPETWPLTITNSIIFSNSDDNLACGSGCTVSYSDVEGGAAGTSNIDADPLFADAANGDYHLSGGSPAIDAGTNDGAPSTDLDGNVRPLDGNGDGTAVTDMGAYEFKLYRLYLPLAIKN